MYRLSALLLLLGVLAGCGGAGGSSNRNSGSAPPPPPNLGGGSVAKPVVVTVSAGQTVSGTNITVVPPASPTPPNAMVLGVAALTGAGEAFNTGAKIAQGATQRVLLFGPGLGGTLQVTITGPNDISISSITSIKATDNTPGVAFIATVSAGAALGCRTIVLQTSNGDITTFTGGLEVVP